MPRRRRSTTILVEDRRAPEPGPLSPRRALQPLTTRTQTIRMYSHLQTSSSISTAASAQSWTTSCTPSSRPLASSLAHSLLSPTHLCVISLFVLPSALLQKAERPNHTRIDGRRHCDDEAKSDAQDQLVITPQPARATSRLSTALHRWRPTDECSASGGGDSYHHSCSDLVARQLGSVLDPQRPFVVCRGFTFAMQRHRCKAQSLVTLDRERGGGRGLDIFSPRRHRCRA